VGRRLDGHWRGCSRHVWCLPSGVRVGVGRDVAGPGGGDVPAGAGWCHSDQMPPSSRATALSQTASDASATAILIVTG
jgi:hypothetical protein